MTTEPTTTASPTDTAGARYHRPGWFTRRVCNPMVAFSTRRGLSVSGSRVLAVRGRSTGQVRTTVVNLLTVDGVQYLVAPRGQTQWVRNLRVAGEGSLAVGRRIQPFSAVELGDAAKPPVLRAYLERWAWEVGAFFDGLDAHSDDDRIDAVAPGFPVFAIDVRDAG